MEKIMIWRNSEDNIADDEITSLIVHLTMNIPHQRIENYFESWIGQYIDEDFFSLFRMTPETFNVLMGVVNCHDKPYVGGGWPVPIEKAFLMTIWWLGKGEVLLSVADRFNVAVSTVYNVTEFVLDKLIALIERYIVWPDHEEMLELENNFRQKSGYPGVIGAIDVCNIKFKAPVEQQDSYIDKNNNHSIKLQAVATYNKVFTSILVGYPGSVHDSRIFRNWRLYVDAEENNLLERYFYNEDFHLVGDKAYPLRKWIMTPFKDNGHLTNRQRHHNTCHSITRMVVEHTFGILKSRWRILKSVNCNSIQKTIRIISACCVLHNFCFIHHDLWDAYEPLENDDEIHDQPGDVPEVAQNKRLEIMNHLWQL